MSAASTPAPTCHPHKSANCKGIEYCRDGFERHAVRSAPQNSEFGIGCGCLGGGGVVVGLHSDLIQIKIPFNKLRVISFQSLGTTAA